MRRTISCVLAVALAVAVAGGSAAARQASPNRATRSAGGQSSIHPHRADGTSVLLYGPSIDRHATITEETVAEGMGFDVTRATRSAWAGMSESDFAAFDAIVFGDPDCTTTKKGLRAAKANRAVWSAAVHGPIVVEGTDAVYHANEGKVAAAEQLIADTLAWATKDGPTGLAVSLSCYYAGATPGTRVGFLSEFGRFTVQGQGHAPLPGCPDRIETPDPSDPFLVDLTAADLSNWGCSIHEAFDEFPYGYRVVAQHKKSDLPYIVAGRRL